MTYKIDKFSTVGSTSVSTHNCNTLVYLMAFKTDVMDSTGGLLGVVYEQIH